MANQSAESTKGDFVSNLGKIYGFYTGGFFGFLIHMFVVPLNKITIPIVNFPLGFYMAAQGSLIAFVVMLFIFARKQDQIDREFGMAEDD